MTRSAAAPLGVVVDFDPASWLPGPSADATKQDVAAWIEGAVLACAADFGVAPEAEAHEYLREMLTGFATAELACDFRFLRLRAPDDAPLIARLVVLQGAARDEVAATVKLYDDSLDLYDAEPRVETVDEDRGLRRNLVFYLDEGVRSIVRYHRRVEDWETDVLLSCAGADLKATAEGLHDLDQLSQAVWVVDEEGNRR